MALASQTHTGISPSLAPAITKPFTTVPDITELEVDSIEAPVEEKNLSSSISKTWTDQAIKCYLTKADCSNCSVMRGNYSFTCQMNKVVPILVEVLGEPDSDRIDGQPDLQ